MRQMRLILNKSTKKVFHISESRSDIKQNNGGAYSADTLKFY